MRRRPLRGFTLIEILVAVALLALSTAAIVTLWSVARRITERSRDAGEAIAVARQEAERDKAALFNGVFIKGTGAFTANNPKRTDYDQYGTALATNLAANAAPTANSVYRAVSTYTRTATGSETDPNRMLGIQRIDVYDRSGNGFSNTAVYSTAIFFTAAGV